MIKQQEKLSPLQVENQLKALALHFQQHTERHEQINLTKKLFQKL